MEIARATKASSLPSSIATSFKYDVFLSFSGVDTRLNFTSHLLTALKRHGFDTFIDDEKLERGEYIKPELLKAIEESRISLVILSKNYAASTWCLDELVKIMECKNNLRQIVFPIFHGVETSDVRGQKGMVADAFDKHAKRFSEGHGSKIEKWKEALTQVASLAGWDLPNVDNGHEAKLIQKIIEEVGKRLNVAHPNVTDHQVGLKSRLEKLNVCLSMESNDVRIVGILGIGGIGKTTIAMKQYYLIRHMFEGSSFLANVRDKSKPPNDLVALQKQLLSDICGNGTHNVTDQYQGIEVIKRRAFCRKVLLVLDDVDDFKQFKLLAKDRHSFIPGSRIIITTRDVSLLKLLEVDYIYAPEELDRTQSLELLSWHAFKEDHPKDDYLDLSNQVVDYAGGLPLALEVLGSYLHEKSIREWESAISRLKNCPDAKIQATLKISFDSLGRKEKELFLDIACFFVGKDRNFTLKVLEGCQKYAENGIRDLANLCLLKYHNNKIEMHDLIRDMGREINWQEFKETGRWSRLWNHEDALAVLEDATGTEAVEGLCLNFDELNVVHANSKAFEKMNRLWLLHLNNVHLKEGYEHISSRLMWLSWNHFPLKYLPSNLHLDNLVTLDLRYSSLKKLWKETKILVKLKFLYLSYCYHLIETPDFSVLKNLEELLLNGCVRLEEVHDSIKFLSNLVILDMENCSTLRKFPSGILMLESLEILNLSGCSMLGKFSGFTGSPWKSLSSFLSSSFFRTKGVESTGFSASQVNRLCCLTKLSMGSCNMSSLPIDIGNLISLETLDIYGNNLRTLPDSICNLTRLNYLGLGTCNLSHLPSEIGRLTSLRSMHLERNDLLTLPDSFCDLDLLTYLDLSDCSLSHLPSEIGRLTSLTTMYLGRNDLLTLPDSFCDLDLLTFLDLTYCSLSHLPDQIGKLSSLKHLYMSGTDVCSLPNSFSDLANLESLELGYCGRLRSLPQLPVNLLDVDTTGLTSLESMPTEINWRTGLEMSLAGCTKLLAKNEFANNVMEGIGQALPYFKDEENWDRKIISLPGDEVPNWFQYQYTGSKLYLVVPPQETRRILGWCLCIVLTTHRSDGDYRDVRIICYKPTRFNHRTSGVCNGQDQMIILYYPSDSRGIHSGDELEIEINADDPSAVTVKKCGINFIYENDEDHAEMPIKKKRKITLEEIN